MKIVDFDYGLGGFTTGMEEYDEFEVISAPWINQEASLCYNVNHKNLFEIGGGISEDFDIMVFNPFLGDKFLKSGKNNFNSEEIVNVINIIKKHLPDYAVITTKNHAFLFLNSKDIGYTGDGWPLYDIVCNSLFHDYNVFQYSIDGAEYGIPQHVILNCYICVKKDIDVSYVPKPKPLYNIKNGFITIRDAIGDIEDTDYSSFTNRYIKYCTNNGLTKLTWHNPNFKFFDNCSLVKEGEGASNTSELSQSSGYNRPKYDRIAPKLNFDFYLVSSKATSIHPVKNRPFTIREGARLFGFPDTFVWNNNLSKRKVGRLIFNTPSPIFGKVVAEMFLQYIG